MNNNRIVAALVTVIFFMLAAASPASAGNPLTAQLDRIAREGDDRVWVSYTVPLRAGTHRLCCYEDTKAGWSGRCDLDRGSLSVNDADEPLPAGLALKVLLRFDDGELARVLAYDSLCRIAAGGADVRALGDVAGADSVAYLAGTAGRDEEDLLDGALMAIAFHADPLSLTTLTGFTQTSEPAQVRAKAAFWLGATRGDEVFETLRRMVREDPSSEVREQAVFAVSISDARDAEPLLLDLARTAESAEVRSTALFWLGQKVGERIADTLRDAAVDDPELEVKEQAVFALSQLPDGQGVTRLIELARTHRNPEIRQTALFWLGQSGDPRALDLFEELLD
jgi:HEAT repeat protein